MEAFAQGDLAENIRLGAAWVMAITTAWLALAGTVETVLLLRARDPGPALRALRRATGSGLVTASVAAALSAAGVAHAQTRLPAPDRTETPILTAGSVQRRTAPALEHHRVRPGESLWSITAARLPGTSRPTDVAAAVQDLYAVNRDLIGPDPDLIHPGALLRLPEASIRGGRR